MANAERQSCQKRDRLAQTRRSPEVNFGRFLAERRGDVDLVAQRQIFELQVETGADGRTQADDFNDYYLVPGTWVMAPEIGFLWTPAPGLNVLP